jgi:alpha-tubulin suppressor-like RCC1 family protein
LGNGTTINSLVPVDVSNAPSGITRLRAGSDFTCALTSSRKVYCWGSNSTGQLGNGSIGGTFGTPVEVAGITSAVDLAVGASHACAVLENGTVACWGLATNRQLGNGSTSNSGTPVPASGITTAQRVAAGSQHSCAALATTGEVWCWGNNAWNALAIGDGLNGGTPSKVQGGLASIVKIGASASSTCAIDSGGAVFCWGASSAGQVGAGTTLAYHTAPALVSVGNATAVGGGADFVCVSTGRPGGATLDESLYCFGNDNYGTLGKGTVPFQGSARLVDQQPGAFTALSAGDISTCGISAGKVYCWGANSHGQLGDGTQFQRRTPMLIPGYTTATTVAAGGRHACASLADGKVYCWGSNITGQLGNNTLTSSLLPVQVSGVNTASKVVAGFNTNCALLTNGSLKCWGLNDHGQLGTGILTDSSVPVPVTGLPGTVSAVALGPNTACAISNSALYCWGDNREGQIGNGTTSASQATPALVSLPSGTTPSAVAVGQNHACAILTNSQVYCWGRNDHLQLGNTTPTSSTVPVLVQDTGPNPSAISAWGSHTCVNNSDSRVRCWGQNFAGQIGNDATADVATPFPTSGVYNLLAAGSSHTCAQRNETLLRCWGYNDYGQLGRGTAWLYPVPAPWEPDYTQPDTCTPNCTNKHCGDDPSDECGGTCTISCECTTDANCPAGQLCGMGVGPNFGQAPGTNRCWPASCATNAEAACGSPTAPCGLCGEKVSGCQSDAQCAPGLKCWVGGGLSFDLPQGTNVCVQARCTDGTRVPNDCGAATATCGHCAPRSCESDADCVSGESCGANNGTNFGLSPETKVCWPSSCSIASFFSNHCGDTTAPCGSCACIPYCTGKTCGDDLSDGCGGFCSGICPGACRDASLSVVDVEADFRDIWAGRENSSTGKESDALPSITLRFNRPIEPGRLSGRLVGLTAGTKDEPTNCVDSNGAPLSAHVMHQALLVTDSNLALSDTVTVRPDRRLRAGCEYRLIVNADPLTANGSCLASAFHQSFLVTASKKTKFDRETGKRRYQGIPRIPVYFEARTGVRTPTDRIFERYGGDLGLRPGIDSFSATTSASTSPFRAGRQIRRFGQLYRGIPVKGMGYTVEEDDSIFDWAVGRWLPGIETSVIPTLSSEQAVDAALAHVSPQIVPWQTDPPTAAPPTAELVLKPVNARALPPELRLLWRIQFHGIAESDYTDVDAVTGLVLFNQPNGANITECGGFDPSIATLDHHQQRHATIQFNSTVSTDRDDLLLGVWSQGNYLFEAFNNTEPFPHHSRHILIEGPLQHIETQYVCRNTDGTMDTETAAVARAHWAVQATERVFRDSLGWAGITGDAAAPGSIKVNVVSGLERGSGLQSRFDYEVDELSIRTDQLFPGVVAHEVAHGLTFRSRGGHGLKFFRYEAESGSLAEASSDIMHALMLQKTAPVGVDPWCVTVEGEVCDRNLAAPADSVPSAPDTYGVGEWHPKADLCHAANHNCYIHENGTVVGHWAYLLTKGRDATEPNGLGCFTSVRPLVTDPDRAIESVANLVLSTFATLDAEANFEDAALATSVAAEKQFGDDAKAAVDRAWSAVGVGERPPPTTVMSPADGETNVEPWPGVFRFAVGEESGPWLLRISKDPNFSIEDDPLNVLVVPIDDVLEVDSVRYATAQVKLDAGTQYYWQAREGIEGETIPWNAWDACATFTASFTTAKKEVELVVPDSVRNGEHYQTGAWGFVRWEGLAGATEYQVTLRDEEDGCDRPADEWTSVVAPAVYLGNTLDPDTQTGYTILRPGEALDPDHTYHLYVRPLRYEQLGTCTHFAIRKPKLLSFQAIAPLSGATVAYGSGGPFVWKRSPGAVSYELKIKRFLSSSDLPLVADEIVSDASAPVNADGNIEYTLEDLDVTKLEGQLTWTVSALDADGNRREMWTAPISAAERESTLFLNGAEPVREAIAEHGTFGMPNGDEIPLSLVFPLQAEHSTSVCFKVPGNTVGIWWWFGVAQDFDPNDVQSLLVEPGTTEEYALCTPPLSVAHDDMVLAVRPFSATFERTDGGWFPQGFGPQTTFNIHVKPCGGLGDNCCTTGNRCVDGASCRNSVCVECGKLNDVCCDYGSTKCSGKVGEVQCFSSRDACERCGGISEQCCVESRDSSWDGWGCRIGSQCTGGTDGVNCHACGKAGQECCRMTGPDGHTVGYKCLPGAACNLSNHTCESQGPPKADRRCEESVQAGGNDKAEYTIELGQTSGRRTLWIDTYTVPDRFKVYYQGQMVADTGCLGSGTEYFCTDDFVTCCNARQCATMFSYSGQETQVTVKVEPNCNGTTDTAWRFSVSCQ